MSMNPILDSTIGAQRSRLRRRSSSYVVKKETLVHVLLTSMLYLSLWRATGMWYGYPSRFDEGVSVDPLPMKLLLYSLIGFIGCYVWLEPKRILSYLRNVSPLVVFVSLVCFASIFVSVDRGASIRGLAAVGLLTIAPLFYRLRYGTVKTLDRLASFATIAAFANILYLIAFPQFAIMGGTYAGMVKALFYHKNGLGQFCAVAFIALVSLGMPTGPLTYRKLIRWTALLLTFVLIILTKSSTAVVMIGVGLSTMAGMRALQTIGHSSARATVVLLACILLGLAGSFAYIGVAESIAAAFGKDLTFSGRSDIWELLLPLVYDRPLLGHGFATFRQASIIEQYVVLSHDVRSVHNTYLELGLNIGIPATLAWIVFLVMRLFKKINAFYPSQKVSESQAKEIVIILLVMIGSMMEAGMMIAPVVLWPLLVIALPMSVEDRSPRKSGDSMQAT